MRREPEHEGSRRPAVVPQWSRLTSEMVAGLVEQLPEGLVVADDQGRLVWANRRADRLVGTALTERMGEPVADVLAFVDAQNRSWWDGTDPWHGLHTRTGSPEQWLRLPNGRGVLVAARYRRSPDRRISYVVVTLRDPRARERIEADSSALITTVAHELRSPLTSVRGFSRTLRERWGQLDDDQKLWMLEAIENDTVRLSRLVGELLEISRIDTGRLRLRLQPLNLVEMVDAQVERLVTAGHDPARFVVDAVDPQPEVWGDEDRITQVVNNLLENSIRHGAGTITVRIAVEDDGLGIRVVDEGPGISLQQRELAFTRFWQGQTHGGSGLGLYVVRRLVEAHGGRADVVEQAEGTALRVVLPIGLPESLR